MSYEGLRPYLQVLEQRGMMRWVDKEVDKDWEISAVLRMIFRAMSEGNRYGIGFRNIKGYPGGRVVAGVVAASREMIATAIGCEPNFAAIHEKVIEGIANPIEPVIVDDGPCKEVIVSGDDVDLNALPIPVWTPEKDAGSYLTPLWVTKDPDDGRRNIGIRRCQIKGKDKTGILFGAPDRGGAIHWEKWKARGKNMPAAIFIGGDPAQYVVAPARYGADELAVAGGIRGEAIPLVRCETVDLEVPAHAEIVIEGEVLTDSLEPEGPFGEFTGYMAGGRHAPVFKVNCITHRKDPILLGIISQLPPSESSMIKRSLLEAGLKKHLSEDLRIPGIADVHALEAGGCTATLWISLRKMYAGHVDQAVFGALGHMGMSYFKWIVVTDDDIDIEDPFMRDWIMAWRVRPEHDLRVIETPAAVELDPSSFGPDAPEGGAVVRRQGDRRCDPEMGLSRDFPAAARKAARSRGGLGELRPAAAGGAQAASERVGAGRISRHRPLQDHGEFLLPVSRCRTPDLVTPDLFRGPGPRAQALGRLLWTPEQVWGDIGGGDRARLPRRVDLAPDRGVVGRFLLSPRVFVYARCREPVGGLRRQQQMVDQQAEILLPRAALVVPETV